MLHKERKRLLLMWRHLMCKTVQMLSSKIYQSGNGEADDTSLTKSSVEGLIRDGLRLRDAKVIKAVRKVNKSNRRPGVVIATLETTQQKEKVMKDKYKLKTNAKYRDVYIENEKPKDDLKADQKFAYNREGDGATQRLLRGEWTNKKTNTT